MPVSRVGTIPSEYEETSGYLGCKEKATQILDKLPREADTLRGGEATVQRAKPRQLRQGGGAQEKGEHLGS